jgi:hypothetical protein
MGYPRHALQVIVSQYKSCRTSHTESHESSGGTCSWVDEKEEKESTFVTGSCHFMMSRDNVAHLYYSVVNDSNKCVVFM